GALCNGAVQVQARPRRDLFGGICMSDQTIGDRPAALRPDYEFGEAALSGLRLIMRKPKVLPWWIAFNAVFLAAILSLVFTRFGYLRIGADEARAMVVILALGIIRFVVQMLFSIGIAGLGAVVIGVQHSAGNRLGAEFLQQFLQLPMYALLIFLFLKFCFALP